MSFILCENRFKYKFQILSTVNFRQHEFKLIHLYINKTFLISILKGTN